MNKKTILSWILIISAIFGTVGLLARWEKSTKEAERERVFGEILTARADDHVKGAAVSTGELVVIKYSDFQCPACARAATVWSGLDEELKKRITFVYRHFPLTSIHSSAVPAARAVEAAAKQGKFWEYHDLLFRTQKDWAEKTDVEPFAKLARQLGLDEEKFRTDWASEEVLSEVERDAAEAETLRLTATPTFFVNGEQVSLPMNTEVLTKVLEDLLKK